MKRRVDRTWRRFGGRYAAAVVGAILLLLLGAFVETRVNAVVFTLPVAGVVLATVALGTGPGLLLSLIVGVGTWYFLTDPVGSFSIASPHEIDHIAAYFATSAIIIWTIDRLRRARSRLAAAKSEAERTLALLRKSSERLQVLSEAMPQFVFALAPDGTAEYVNPQWTAFSGLDLEATNRVGWSGFIHPDDLELARGAWRDALERSARFSLELRYRAVDGSYRWFLTMSAPLDPASPDGSWIGTSTDVHERREAHDALRVSEERLRGLYGDLKRAEAEREALLAEVQRRAAQLEEADRNKNEFLAVLSHELRNPLAPIRNSVYILEHAVPGGLHARKAQQVIERQVHQLTRLIDDLLDVTRISRGKIRLRRERVDLNDLVRRTAEDHRSVFVANDVQLECSTARVPLFVDGDRARLAQVIGNLLQNAAKFTPAGGHAGVFVRPDDSGHAVVRVRDDGVGISEDVLVRLFQPFVQAEKTLDRSRGGLGLGLALVKGVTELHGGEVSVRSEGAGRGAEFSVRLPLTAIVGDSGRRTPVEGPRQAGRRVLVIEDNVDTADSLRQVLEMKQHRVDVAHSGPEGIDKARIFQPEVVLCDIGLPHMDGYEVARRLRAEPDLQELRLVALSGYALPEDLERSRQAGFDDHLPKPPSLETLERLLRPAATSPVEERPGRPLPRG